MSDKERTGIRDLTYSRWHRTEQLERYLGRHRARECAMIDIDGCEYCCYCSTPLALIETQVTAAAPKKATVTARLAALAKIRAYSVSCIPDGLDVASFRVRRIEPPSDVINDVSPLQYAEFVYSFRVVHRSACTRNRR